MERLSILDTLWYNSAGSFVTFKRLIVLVDAGLSTTSSTDAVTELDDDVVSYLDKLRRASPISLPI